MEEIFELFFYLIGFFIYLGFTIYTFEVFSKGKTMTKAFPLIFIYIYNSILVIYVLSWVDANGIFMERVVYSLLYLILAAISLKKYYSKYVSKEDDKLFRQG